MQKQGRDLRQQPQYQADRAADQGAVDTDKLQVFADIEFNLPLHIPRIPAFDRIADMTSQEGGKLWRHPMGRLLQVFV